jgi:hypothetical protein
MVRSYFEEVQALKDNRWIWMLLIVASLGALLPLIYGLYWQVGNGQPWGNEPMSDNALIALTVFIFMAMIATAWILLSVKLEVKIDPNGIHYKFFPDKPAWRLISRDEIDSYEIRKRSNIFELVGFGSRGDWLKETKSLAIRGTKHLLVQLKNRERIILGTQDPEAMERALEKLLHKKQVY